MHKGLKVCVVFEGRDGAGKGGTIKAITERVSPRVFRVIALPAPTRAREDPDVRPALHPALPGRRRGRHLRPQLVQPRRRRARHGLLHRGAGHAIPEDRAALREADGRIRDHPAQVLAGGEPGGADAAARSRASTTAARSGSSRRWTSSPTAAGTTTRRARDEMFAATDTLVGAVVRGALRRQEAGAPERHQPPAEHVPYKAIKTEKVKLPKRKIGRYQAADYPYKYVEERF